MAYTSDKGKKKKKEKRKKNEKKRKAFYYLVLEDGSDGKSKRSLRTNRAFCHHAEKSFPLGWG